ncbi:hypothetical protein [Gloeocapsopsis dulcis]|uniref:hypothetical protein n=1 Tax=Gloeocapsopsis dulcis TaxID=2859516 RepID=UPI001F4094AA|nr:hypothetical protein [Gloeocapsopsis dulcis]WNN89556.1 hypothetical protein P0S91_00155 [Gloeocapsopsis dulcis]
MLKLAALASGTVLATHALPYSEKAWSRDRKNPRIAIIGGGTAELNTAYQLKKAGISFCIRS